MSNERITFEFNEEIPNADFFIDNFQYSGLIKVLVKKGMTKVFCLNQVHSKLMIREIKEFKNHDLSPLFKLFLSSLFIRRNAL